MTESTQNADFRRKPQIFADSPLLLEIPAFGGRRKPQKTADSRKEPKIFAENLRESFEVTFNVAGYFDFARLCLETPPKMPFTTSINWSRVWGRRCDEVEITEEKPLFTEWGRRHSVNGGVGKECYRNSNSVKRFRPFSESPDSKNLFFLRSSPSRISAPIQVGAPNRPRKRKRTNRENPPKSGKSRKHRETPKKLEL